MTVSTPSTTPEDLRTTALLRIIEKEIVAMQEILPDALSRQWDASPVPKPREDTTERSSGGRPANPTADTALDPRRIAVRESVVRSTTVLRGAAIALVAARKNIERTVAAFDGERL